MPQHRPLGWFRFLQSWAIAKLDSAVWHLHQPSYPVRPGTRKQHLPHLRQNHFPRLSAPGSAWSGNSGIQVGPLWGSWGGKRDRTLQQWEPKGSGSHRGEGTHREWPSLGETEHVCQKIFFKLNVLFSAFNSCYFVCWSFTTQQCHFTLT